MLTVASPKASAADIEVRTAKLREAISVTRASHGGSQDRASIVVCFPAREDSRLIRLGAVRFVDHIARMDATLDPALIEARGCVGADIKASKPEPEVLDLLQGFLLDRYPRSQWTPDVWQPFVVKDIAELPRKVASVAGEKYSYRELDQFTDVMEKALLATGRKDVNAPLVAKVDRWYPPAEGLSAVLPGTAGVVRTEGRNSGRNPSRSQPDLRRGRV
jgi:multidrug efflux pump